MDKKEKRRGIIVIVIAFLLAFAAQLAGVAAGVKLGDSYKAVLITIAIISGVLPLLAIPANILLSRSFNKKTADMSVKDRQSFITAHREQAEKTAAEKLRLINKIKTLSGIYAATVGLCGVVFAFSTGAVCPVTFSYPLLVCAVFFTACALARIPARVTEEAFEGDKNLMAQSDYPQLYALAQKAATAVGCNYPVQLGVSGDFNAGIAKVGNTCFVQLGALLVNTLSEAELYTVLLHEFAHISLNRPKDKHYRHIYWITHGVYSVPMYTIISTMFLYPDALYRFHFALYTYAASVVNETKADLAKAQHGDVKAAASALLKIKYFDLFLWEDGTYDTPSLCAAEDKQPSLGDTLAEYNGRLAKRADFWRSLVDKELISNRASHPTIKMRIEALGVQNAELLPTNHSAEYGSEAKALLALADRVYGKSESEYAEARENLYLKPKARVEEWENAGKPITAEGYADIVDDLRTLGRNIEANELCRQVLETLSDTAAYTARFMYGAFLLHSFNPEGVEHLYKAVDENHNIAEEALDMIGHFCCLVGDEEGLERYREQCSERLQFMEDAYEKTGYITADDVLLPEQLPDGMLEDILSYLHSIDGGRTERVYLVNKPITESFSTSAFVLRLDVDTPADDAADIFHKMFRYLDTRFEHQFSLFDVTDVPMKKIEAVENSLVYQKQ